MAARTLVAVRFGPDGLARLDHLADTYSTEDRKLNRSDVIRMAVAAGLPAVERDLKRRLDELVVS